MNKDLWAPLYKTIKFPNNNTFAHKIIDQMYYRACRRYSGDACQRDIIFYDGGLFDLVNGYDKFGMKKKV